MPKVIVRALGLSALLVSVAQGSFVQAQKGAPPLRINFRAVTEDGQQVTDLKPEEMSLKINGKPRQILSLSMSQSTPGGANEGHAGLPIPYATNTIGTSGRVFYLLIDNDSIAPGREGPMKEAVSQLAAELSSGDLIGVLTTEGELNITPTNDVTKVRLAIDQMAGKGSASETDADAQCRTTHVLRDLGTMIALGGATPTTLVVFSGGLSIPENKIVNVGGRTRTAVGGSSAPSNATSDVCPVRPEDFANIGTLASTANVDLYMLHLTEAMANRSSTQDAGFESLAGATGAEFVRIAGSPQAPMARLLRETSTYYTLTFEPDASEHSGQALRVDLKSTRDKVKVHARPAVDAPKVAAKSASPRDMLRTAAEYRDLPIRAAAYPAPAAGSSDVTIVALFESIDGAPLTSASVGLFDEKNTLKKQWTATAEELSKRPATAALPAPAGSYRVRVAAVDGSGRTGTADYPLEAQVARADPLKLSALVLGTQGTTGFAPRLEFKDEPVAIGMLQIYGVPKGGTIKMDLDVATTPEGPALATADTTVVPSRSAEDQRIAFGGFSIDALQPGDYLMRAVVSLDGKPVGKVVRTLRKSK